MSLRLALSLLLISTTACDDGATDTSSSEEAAAPVHTADKTAKTKTGAEEAAKAKATSILEAQRHKNYYDSFDCPRYFTAADVKDICGTSVSVEAAREIPKDWCEINNQTVKGEPRIGFRIAKVHSGTTCYTDTPATYNLNTNRTHAAVTKGAFVISVDTRLMKKTQTPACTPDQLATLLTRVAERVPSVDVSAAYKHLAPSGTNRIVEDHCSVI